MARSNGVLGLLDRNRQLDLIAYGLITAFMLLTTLLGFMVINSISPPEGWLLQEHTIQLMGLLLAGMMMLYLLDQHRRLRTQLAHSHSELEDSKNAAVAACRRLTTAHRAAEIMVLVSEDGQLQQVADHIRADLMVDGVAVVSEKLVLSTEEVGNRQELAYTVERLAADAVMRGETVRRESESDSRHLAGIPLRVLGRLRGVLCVWHSSPLPDAEVDGLALTARVIELGWESRLMFEGVNQQLDRVISVVSSLIEVRVPGYAADSDRIAQLAARVGAELGMDDGEIADLRIAVRLRDLGVLNEYPSDSVFGIPNERRATAEHPRFGAQLAEKVGLSSTVQEAIMHHHEDYAGTGYPAGERGDRIPLASRVIRAAEACIHLGIEPGDTDVDPRAMSALLRGSGTAFDPRVIAAIVGEGYQEAVVRRIGQPSRSSSAHSLAGVSTP